jgi:hypothetical protein
MKTTIYWTCTHLRRAASDFRFAAKLWWLNRQVEFLDWRGQMEALLPSSRLIPAPQPISRGGRHAMQLRAMLHGQRTPSQSSMRLTSQMF